jgi:hypothetical protein
VSIAVAAAALAVILGAVGWWISSEKKESVAQSPKKIAPVSITVEPSATPEALTAVSAPPRPDPAEVPLPDGELTDGDVVDPPEEEEEELEPEAAPSRPRGERAERIRDRARRASAKKPAATGFLNVGAKPWAEIEIDGKKWPYQTPQAGIELAVGKHVVRLSNRETGVSKTAVVHIKAGAYRTVSLDLRTGD